MSILKVFTRVKVRLTNSVLKGKDVMIIKNYIFELEISEGIGVYFGSKGSGQHFKKWEDFKEEEKQQIKLIKDSVENLLKASENTFLTHPNK